MFRPGSVLAVSKHDGKIHRTSTHLDQRNKNDFSSYQHTINIAGFFLYLNVHMILHVILPGDPSQSKRVL